jgi:cell division protein ZapE
MSEGPLMHYRARLHAEIRADPAQELAAEKLESLHHALAAYRPLPGRGGWKERFGLARSRAEPPQGLYIYGGVGRGKSMLMDLFFRAAPVFPEAPRAFPRLYAGGPCATEGDAAATRHP